MGFLPWILGGGFWVVGGLNDNKKSHLDSKHRKKCNTFGFVKEIQLWPCFCSREFFLKGHDNLQEIEMLEPGTPVLHFMFID